MIFCYLGESQVKEVRECRITVDLRLVLSGFSGADGIAICKFNQPASEPKSPKHDAGHAVQDLKGCMREQCSVKAGLHYVAVNWLYWFSAFAAGFITERNFCREARSREVVMYLACSIRSGLQCW